jgi:hypothetical protein
VGFGGFASGRSLLSGIGRPSAGDDRRSPVNVSPPDDGKEAGRLLDHGCGAARLAQVEPRARERLEVALGGELARRLVGALSGDHRLPVRAFGD